MTLPSVVSNNAISSANLVSSSLVLTTTILAIIITPSLIISMVTSLLRPFRTLPWWGTSFLLPSSLEKEPGTRFRVDARMKYTLCGDCRYAGLGLWYPEYAQKHVDVAQMQLHNMWNYEKWQELDIYPHITSKLKKNNGKQSCQKKLDRPCCETYMLKNIADKLWCQTYMPGTQMKSF